MDNLLWWIGWRSKVGFVLFLVVGIALSILFKSSSGMFFGIPFIALWFWGTVYINKNWEEYLNKGNALAIKTGAGKLNINPEESERYLLFAGRGSALLVKPHQEYSFTVLYVCKSSLGVYDKSSYNLVKRTYYVSSGHDEYYYRQMTSANYESPYFSITLSSRETVKYHSDESADSAVTAVRKKLREAQT